MPVYRLAAETVTLASGEVVTRPRLPQGENLQVSWIGNTDGSEYLIVTVKEVGPLKAAEVQLADRHGAPDLVERMQLTPAEVDLWHVQET